VAVTPEKLTIAAGTLDAGTVAGLRMAEMTPGYTANRAVNAVPYVCAAPPGIRTTVDPPQIIPALGGSLLAAGSV
jgi:hypothetical protein